MATPRHFPDYVFLPASGQGGSAITSLRPRTALRRNGRIVARMHNQHPAVGSIHPCQQDDWRCERLVEAAGVEPASEAEFPETSTSVSRTLISPRSSSRRDPLRPAAVSVPGRG